MKAFWCGGDIGECADLIFADTAGKARVYSYGYGQACCDLALIEIEVRRAPGADKHLDPKAATAYATHDAEAWRDAGGHDESALCDTCGLCEMAEREKREKEWAVCDDCLQCGECGCTCEDQ